MGVALAVASTAVATAASRVRTPEPVAIARDGSLVAVVLHNRPREEVITFVDPHSGRVVSEVPVGRVPVMVRMCGDSRRAMALTEDGLIREIQIESATSTVVHEIGPTERAEISPSCRFVGLYSPERPGLALRELASGTVTEARAPFGISAACFLGNDHMMATLSITDAVRVTTFSSPPEIEQLSSGKLIVGFGCLGSQVAISDPLLSLHQPGKGKRASSGPILCDARSASCALSSRRQFIATIRGNSGSIQNSLILYSMRDNTTTELELPSTPSSIAVSDDGLVVVTFAARPPMLLLPGGDRPSLRDLIRS